MFPYPPVYHQGRVYAPAVLTGNEIEIYVVAFDARTGENLWTNFICSSRTTGQFGGFRGGPATLTAIPVLEQHGGLLYLMSNIGVMAEIHGASGSVQWLAKYETPAQNRGQRGVRRVSVNTSNALPSRPVVHNGVVYALPTDRVDPVAYDVRTGEPKDIKWGEAKGSTFGTNGTGYTHFVGVASNHLIFVNDRHILGFNLKKHKSPKVLPWHLEGARYETMGLVRDDLIYLPNTHNLMIVNSSDWKRLVDKDENTWASDSDDPADADQLVGNIAVFGHLLVTAGPNRAMAYTDLETFNNRFERLRRERPNDPEVIYEHAVELFNNRQVDVAEEEFKRVIELTGDAPSEPHLVELQTAARDQLFALALHRARKLEAEALGAKNKQGRVEKIVAAYETARGYAPDTARWAEASIGLAGTFEVTEDYSRAIQLYQDLIENAGSEQYVSDGSDPIDIRVGIYARDQINTLILNHSRAVYVESGVEARAAEAFAAAADEAAIKAAIEKFPNSEQAQDRLVGEMVNAYKAKTMGECLSLAQDLIKRYPFLQDSPEIDVILVDCYQALRRRDRVEAVLRRIESREAVESVQVADLTIAIKDVTKRAHDWLNNDGRFRTPDFSQPFAPMDGLATAPDGETVLGPRPLSLNNGQPAFDDGSILIANGGHLQRWDPVANQAIWSAAMPVGWIGVYFKPNTQNEEAPIRVTTAYENDPAAVAGIEPGDLLIAMDGEPVTSASFRDLIYSRKPGDTVEVTYERDGQQKKVSITLGERPIDQGKNLFGATLVGDNTLVAAWPGVIAGYDCESGRLKWQVPLGRTTPQALLGDDQRVYVNTWSDAERDGTIVSRLVVLDGSTGSLEWTRETELVGNDRNGIQSEVYRAAWAGKVIRSFTVSYFNDQQQRVLEVGTQMLSGVTGEVLEADDHSGVLSVLSHSLDRSSGRFFYMVRSNQLRYARGYPGSGRPTGEERDLHPAQDREAGA
jgi:outer membrane protein assembly factor BamB